MSREAAVPTREQLWIMVDVETSGPVYGRHDMTELGAAVGSVVKGVVDRFEAFLRPEGAEALTSRDSYEKAKARGLPPKDAMRRFADWSKPYLEQGARFVARPAAFDWPWIVHYAWRHLGGNPFGFKAVCASSWFEAQGMTFKVDLPHVAVEDATIQLKRFLEALGMAPEMKETLAGLWTRKTLARSFDSPLPLEQMKELLNSQGPWQWVTGDSHWWGDYLGTASDGPDSFKARIYDVDGYRFEVEFASCSPRAEAEAAWKSLESLVTERLLPLVKAVNVAPCDTLN
ncbi:MAG: hypothetical protein HY927_05050 [Elusimicrobia bacterium]|nr:hypothetical protein [Elusimicrobiota bacterium]